MLSGFDFFFPLRQQEQQENEVNENENEKNEEDYTSTNINTLRDCTIRALLCRCVIKAVVPKNPSCTRFEFNSIDVENENENTKKKKMVLSHCYRKNSEDGVAQDVWQLDIMNEENVVEWTVKHAFAVFSSGEQQ